MIGGSFAEKKVLVSKYKPVGGIGLPLICSTEQEIISDTSSAISFKLPKDPKFFKQKKRLGQTMSSLPSAALQTNRVAFDYAMNGRVEKPKFQPLLA